MAKKRQQPQVPESEPSPSPESEINPEAVADPARAEEVVNKGGWICRETPLAEDILSGVYLVEHPGAKVQSKRIIALHKALGEHECKRER